MKTGLLLLALGGVAALAAAATASPTPRCERPVYLTFDTGHMGVAPLVAEVLARQEVKVTFFLANERTRNGGASLDDEWAPWWKARAAEGHAFGSHTWDHDVWRADVNSPPGAGAGEQQAGVRGAAAAPAAGTGPHDAGRPAAGPRAQGQRCRRLAQGPRMTHHRPDELLERP